MFSLRFVLCSRDLDVVKDHGLFCFNDPQINEVAKTDHMVAESLVDSVNFIQAQS